MIPDVVLVMGVAGSGKTSVGRAVAARLDAAFLEADDYHPPENVERMRRGIPLDDAARGPWLRALNAALREQVATGRRAVLACSALKAAYREVLLDGLPRAVVVLVEVDRPTLERRLRTRTGHFMPASLLDSQLADLERPEGAIVVDGAQAVDVVVRAVIGALRA